MDFLGDLIDANLDATSSNSNTDNNLLTSAPDNTLPPELTNNPNINNNDYQTPVFDDFEDFETNFGLTNSNNNNKLNNNASPLDPDSLYNFSAESDISENSSVDQSPRAPGDEDMDSFGDDSIFRVLDLGYLFF